jgi:hypothetical protein
MACTLSNLLACRKYRATHKEKRKQIVHDYYIRNKEKVSKYHHEHYLKNKERLQEYGKKYRLENKEKINKRIKEWTLKNKKRIQERRRRNKAYRNKQEKIRRQNDINLRILINLRTRLGHALNGETKSASTLKLLGCSIEFLKQHLESQFTDGMNWSNHGQGYGDKGMQEWHIDHIYPCSSFNLKKKSEQFICFNWGNLRPLWAKDNLSRPKR